MLNWFKQDPLKKLQKEYASLMDEAYKMSTVNRKKADELTAKAQEVEQKIIQLQEKMKSN
jgi:hypothetical protein